MRAGKAMTGLMLCSALLTLAACGQKRPLQLPPTDKGRATTPATTPAAAPTPASAASAETMPAR
ncbi:hypothetical protein CDN99_25800 [Roseateles aquatilis]|uniref:Sugar transporter n=1 Tax=Roseateles aquatilis TaxID=431061 RepID=A0A246ITK0_9BURK|nr:lipoprotein [Roseateles aquatilis]OWQ83551.1 hypothetical protein CDN99_25800 [Roseateles aquatilis]